jgi:hypothetical protein
MAKVQRRISAASVSQLTLEQAAAALRALPEKPKETWSLRESVFLLKDTISDALNKGYSYAEVAKMLTQQGVEISASSLKSYLSSAKRSQGDSTRRRRRSATTKSIDADKIAALSQSGLDPGLNSELDSGLDTMNQSTNPSNAVRSPDKSMTKPNAKARNERKK